ncbi:MAG TPA: TonB-dependent receptor [Acidobacteriaceae bacterium]|jgi:hypothetical protein|nr:TonB-dependent receptor [Acidobacteriaceae bacterium]
MLVVTVTPVVCHAASTAAVSGVVRDAQGVGQMGALVEILSASSAGVATAFTDMYGRYRIGNLTPGHYQVRASAALFIPATRTDLRLSPGLRATVNLTLSMLADPTGWLPAKPRGPDEVGDDWIWTMRSGANRPMLRVLGDGNVVFASAAGPEESPSGADMRVRASTVIGNGFASGGVRNAVTLERSKDKGTDLMVRTEVASSSGAPVEFDVGYQRNGFLGNATRTTITYASHPELKTGDMDGMEVLRLAGAQRIQLGDTIDIEAGGTVYAFHMSGNSITQKPFLRVAVHPGELWALQYGFATSTELQEFAALDTIKAALPVAAACGDEICTANAQHHELALSRKIGEGKMEAAVYRDSTDHAEVSGVGAVSAADPISGMGRLVVDSQTNTFRFLGTGYTTEGVRVSFSEPLMDGLWAALEYASGSGLALSKTSDTELHPEGGDEITGSLRAQVTRTGTKVKASYRWQPRHIVTPVDPYGSGANRGYLSFYMRQPVHLTNKLPVGLDLTVDVSNLLAEGYRPFLSADGRTLYLASSPRTLQAGLSFTF